MSKQTNEHRTDFPTPTQRALIYRHMPFVDEVGRPLGAKPGVEGHVLERLSSALPPVALRFLDESSTIVIRAGRRWHALVGFDGSGACSTLAVSEPGESLILISPAERARRGVLRFGQSPGRFNGNPVVAFRIYQLAEVVPPYVDASGLRPLSLNLDDADIVRFLTCSMVDAEIRPAAQVVLQLAKRGPDEQAIAQAAGLPTDTVAAMLERLRIGGLLQSSELLVEWGASPQPRLLGLVLDAMVARGDMVRDPESGRYRLAPTADTATPPAARST